MPYRWISEARKGSWHPTRREAEKAAIEAGVAERRDVCVVWLNGASIVFGDGRRRSS